MAIKHSQKGVSPVISTIIIVAIAIAISIAVALYLTGITGTFTKFERLDVTNVYSDAPTLGSYPITISMRNSGTSVLSIDSLLINGKPAITSVTYGSSTVSLDGSGTAGHIITLAQGDSGTATFGLSDTTYKPGQNLELSFHTVSGKEYPKVLVLP